MTFTFDGWSSRAIYHYLSLTIHYITVDFLLQNFSLGVIYFPESCTAVNLREHLKKQIEVWIPADLELEITIYINTDNEPTMVCMAKISPEWIRIPCFNHTLQLSITHCYLEVDFDDLLKKCRKIIGFFNRSNLGHEALERAQKQLNPAQEPVDVVQDVPSRWNSTYDAMERLVRLKNPLTLALMDSS